MVFTVLKVRAGMLLLIGGLLLWGCGDPEARYETKMGEVRVALEEERAEDAIELLNLLEADDPKRADVLYHMALAHEKIGERLFSAYYYEQAAALDESYAPNWLTAARIYEREGDMAQAMLALDEYLARYPDDADAWRFSAGLLLESRRFQSALTAHMRAQRLEGPSPNPDYATEIAGLYMELGNLAQAETYYDMALESAPYDRLPALLGQLAVYYRINNFEGAEELIAHLDDEYPGALDASNLAATREQIRLWRLSQVTIEREIESLARLDRAQTGDADEEEPEGEIADNDELIVAETEAEDTSPAPGGKLSFIDEFLLETSGFTSMPDLFTVTLPKIGEATTEVAEEVVVPPPPTLEQRAQQEMDNGNSSEAVRLYWQAVGQETDRAELWADLSRASVMNGQFENAEITILEALRRDPNHLDYTLHYLNVIQETRSRARFVEELERAYNRMPNSPDLILALARFYAQPGGNLSNARYFYRQYFQMAPGHPETAEARQEFQSL